MYMIIMAKDDVSKNSKEARTILSKNAFMVNLFA